MEAMLANGYGLRGDGRRIGMLWLLIGYVVLTTMTMAVSLVSMSLHNDIIFPFLLPSGLPGRRLIGSIWGSNNLFGLLALPIASVVLIATRRLPEILVATAALAMTALYILAIANEQ